MIRLRQGPPNCEQTCEHLFDGLWTKGDSRILTFHDEIFIGLHYPVGRAYLISIEYGSELLKKIQKNAKS